MSGAGRRVGWPTSLSELPLGDSQWRLSRPAGADDPAQGWKLHVAATLLSAPEVYRRCVPILRKFDALFKVAATPQALIALNSGASEYAQVGKFITVYPSSTDAAVQLAAELHRATRGLAGPRVPFDERYREGSLLHYRYGAFTAGPQTPAGFIRTPSGRLCRDQRGPGRAVPKWIQDPFPSQRQRRERSSVLLRDYFVFRVKMQRGKGGVYEAVDLTVSPARRVILKEGRRHGEVGLDGSDGRSRLENEARVLRVLHRAGLPVPRVLREFRSRGHLYLVLEFLPGGLLVPLRREQPAKFSPQRAATLLDQLEPLLARVHRAGWVWRDCKPSNILRRGRSLALLDFELACAPNESRLSEWSSRHYHPPRLRETRRRPHGAMEDEYAMGVIAFQFLTGQFPPEKRSARRALYVQTGCPEELQRRIERILKAGMSSGGCGGSKR